MTKLFKCLLWISLGFLTQEMSNGEEEIISSWRSAEQSTQYGTLTADYGVDGNPETCSHTKSQTDPWWKLELKYNFLVNTVAITNLNSVDYHTRINGAVLRVGNFPYDVYSNPICAQIPTLASGATANFSCGGMEGRYVVIHIPGNYKILNICEAVVYGYMPGPVLGRSFVKLQFNSGADLTDQTMSENILQQLRSVLADRGFVNTTLIWSEKPKQVTQKVKTAQSCNKNP